LQAGGRRFEPVRLQGVRICWGVGVCGLGLVSRRACARSDLNRWLGFLWCSLVIVNQVLLALLGVDGTLGRRLVAGLAARSSRVACCASGSVVKCVCDWTGSAGSGGRFAVWRAGFWRLTPVGWVLCEAFGPDVALVCADAGLGRFF
jgi:hypothetical protein